MDNMDMTSMMGMPMNHSMHMMKMYFHTGYENNILFWDFNADSTGAMFGICFLIFVASVLYEGLKQLRVRLHARYLHDRSQSVSGVPTLKGGNEFYSNSKSSLVSHQGDGSCWSELCRGSHFVQTILHMLQAALSYTLMLVFMTFNIWLCLALVLGIGLGYFLFGWNEASTVEGGDNCH